jgi:ABC-type polysaccharide/polyol phosphate export permease
VNSDNLIEEQIQYRITLGNKAYYGNQILSMKSKLKLYWSIIKPIVTYACETWVFKETIKKQSNGI